MTATPTSDLSRRILAPNPGPMTLTGTNTYLLSGEPGHAIVVDPGPADREHLQAMEDAAGAIELVLISHRHHDHAEAIDAIHARTGAPVAAALPEFCRDHAPLHDGERIEAAGVTVEVVATPGHTSDSLSFWLPDDGAHGAMLTGDTILGGSTTVLDFPDGTLRDYLATLQRYERFGPALVLPAHGEAIAALDAEAARLARHRHTRLQQVRNVLSERGIATADADPSEVAALVYADAPATVQAAARLSVAAQLDYLAHER